MRGIVVAIITFVVLMALSVFFIYPAVFGFFQNLFGNHDIGTLVGLVACFLITGTILSISVVTAALAAAVVNTR